MLVSRAQNRPWHVIPKLHWGQPKRPAIWLVLPEHTCLTVGMHSMSVMLDPRRRPRMGRPDETPFRVDGSMRA